MRTTRRGPAAVVGTWMACSGLGCASGCPPQNNTQTTWSITNITADVATSWAGRPLGEVAGSFQRAVLQCPGNTGQEVVSFSPSGSPPPDAPGACATATRDDFETGPYRIQLVQFAPFGTGPVVLSTQTLPVQQSDVDSHRLHLGPVESLVSATVSIIPVAGPTPNLVEVGLMDFVVAPNNQGEPWERDGTPPEYLVGLGCGGVSPEAGVGWIPGLPNVTCQTTVDTLLQHGIGLGIRESDGTEDLTPVIEFMVSSADAQRGVITLTTVDPVMNLQVHVAEVTTTVLTR